MRKFQRGEEPEFLRTRWQVWGQDWQRRRESNRKAQFDWRQLDGEPVNRKLLPHLKAQTQDHCSFCDNFPVSPPSLDTVEHFRPKVRFPLLAYQWVNLYFCCAHCQQKGEMTFSNRMVCLRNAEPVRSSVSSPGRSSKR